MGIASLIDFDQNFGKELQNFCSKSPSPNILSRLVVGVVIKDVARIYDIAIHIIIGLGKLAICTIKISYSIPARLCGFTPNYDIGKEGFAHLGFSGFYLADMFISLTNIINRYPKDKMEKVESFFSRFLQRLKKVAVRKEEIPKTQIQGPQAIFFEEREKYSVKHSPKAAEEMAKISAESRHRLFPILYAEYVENNKEQKNIEKKATVYAKDCIRIYSAMYQTFSPKLSKEEAEKQTLLYAKIYVNAHLKKSARQPKTQSKEETQKQADMHAKYFTKLFFSEYQRCLKNTPETAEKDAMAFTENHIEIFYKACTFPSEISEEKAKGIKDALFEEYIHTIPKIIKEGKNPEFYFIPYAQKYVECQADGRKRSAKKIATRHAQSLTQELTPKMIEQFNKTRMKSVLNKKDSLKKSPT
jgi:hypothetical protein